MSDNQATLLGGIEAGGTKFVCAVAREPWRPIDIQRFATREPESTLREVAAYFRQVQEQHGRLAAMGIGAFGPAGVTPGTAEYGRILTTPKQAWKQFDFLGRLRSGLEDEEIRYAFDTDVNAAAIGEARHGAARGRAHVAYITIGTGVGAGFLHGGAPLHGRMHAEAGHLLVPDLEQQFPPPAGGGPFRGVCPFHGNCLEGRASGPAIEARWGRPARDLPPGHPAWEMESSYLAMGMVGLTAAWSPDVIVIGGGVSQQEGLLERVRAKFLALAGGYWDLPAVETYLVSPRLGQHAGIVGALAMAAEQR